jgi:hypothetical protein
MTSFAILASGDADIERALMIVDDRNEAHAIAQELNRRGQRVMVHEVRFRTNRWTIMPAPVTAGAGRGPASTLAG